jgi:hypothetical protein
MKSSALARQKVKADRDLPIVKSTYNFDKGALQYCKLVLEPRKDDRLGRPTWGIQPKVDKATLHPDLFDITLRK